MLRCLARILMIACIGLSGCAKSSDDAASDNGRDPDPIAARSLLNSGQEPNPDFGAFGYVLLTHRPTTTDDRNRHLSVARAFLGSLESVESYPDDPRSSLMITYWPVQSPSPSWDAEASELVAQYDYKRTIQLLLYVQHRDEVRSDTRGPILVAWDKPYGDPTAKHAMVWDLRTYSDEGLGRAFRIWRERITLEPELWNDGFQLVKFRETVHNELNKYGETLINLIPWPPGS